MARLVDGVNATFEHVASGKGLLLTRRIDPALWPAHLIDPSRLRQILNNLVSNAIKFTHAGTVTLEVKVLESGAGAPETLLQRARYRHRHERRDAAAPVRAVPAGRIRDQPPLRRHRPRARHLAPADRADGRHDPGHQHRRPGHARFGDARRRAGQRRRDPRRRADLGRSCARRCAVMHRPAPGC